MIKGYSFQVNWSFPFCESGWETITTYLDKYTAIKRLEFDSNLARVVCNLRVIMDDKVYGYYDPEQDTRLPGCRHRLIQKQAYFLWEKAGKPEVPSEEFWLQAERELKESHGLVIFR